MQLVCYKAEDGSIPIKEFLWRYAPNKKDSQKNILKKKRAYSKLKSIINLTLERKGLVGGEFTSHLKGDYDFQEIRVKEGDNLVRVLYFCHHQEKLVLLSAFEKPSQYQKGKKKTVDKMIKNELSKAKEFYKAFINNPELYEKY
jgi:phage-related protein